MEEKIISEAILEEAKKHVGIRELSGNNRSFMIDRYNKNVGAPLGSPYCLAGVWWVLDQAAKQLWIKFDLPRTAGTQYFWAHVKENYKRVTPGKGDIAIFRSMDDGTKGHAAIVTSFDFRTGTFDTIEFNTNEAGSRDGQGVYEKKRSMANNVPLMLLGFVSPALAAHALKERA